MTISRTVLLVAFGSCIDCSSASAATSSDTASGKLPRKTPAALLRREQKRDEPATWAPAYENSKWDEVQGASEKATQASYDAASAAASDYMEPSAAPPQAQSRRSHVQLHEPSAEPKADAAFSETEPRQVASAQTVSASRPAAQIGAGDQESSAVEAAAPQEPGTSKTLRKAKKGRKKADVIEEDSTEEVAAEKEVAALKIEEEVASVKEAEAKMAEDAELADKTKKADSCSKYECPTGFKLKANNTELYCLASPCDSKDTEACCDVEIVHVNLNETRYELGDPAAMCGRALMITNETECFNAINLLVVGASTTLDWENYHSAAKSSADPTLPANCAVQKTAPFVFRPIWNGVSPVNNSDETVIPVCKKALFGARGLQGSVGPEGVAGFTGVSGIPGPTGPHGPKGKAASPPEGLVPTHFLAGLIAVNLLSGALVYYVGQKELVQKQDVLGFLPGFSKIQTPAASDSWEQWEEEENWDIDHGDEAYDTSK